MPAPQAVEVGTQSDLLERAFNTNITDTTFPDMVPTTTKPESADGASGTWVVETGKANSIVIYPFGTNADNEDFHMRLYTWTRAVDKVNRTTTLWVPTLICTCACTQSAAMNGVAGAVLSDVEYLCDTITLVSPSPSVALHNWSPGTTTPDISAGCITLDFMGADMFEAIFDTNAGSSAAAGANLLFRFI
jgi:hypothetical protein